MVTNSSLLFYWSIWLNWNASPVSRRNQHFEWFKFKHTIKIKRLTWFELVILFNALFTWFKIIRSNKFQQKDQQEKLARYETHWLRSDSIVPIESSWFKVSTLNSGWITVWLKCTIRIDILECLAHLKYQYKL